MAASKKRFKSKAIPDGKQKEIQSGKHIVQSSNPEQFYPEKPTWSFASADLEMWAFSHDHIQDRFWSEILPYFQSLEKQTWNEILLANKKNNHSLNLDDLNKVAQDRLVELKIEAESLISLRLSGKHRIYGFRNGRVFNILWYDDDHGDNDTCVCRSRKKHT